LVVAGQATRCSYSRKAALGAGSPYGRVMALVSVPTARSAPSFSAGGCASRVERITKLHLAVGLVVTE